MSRALCTQDPGLAEGLQVVRYGSPPVGGRPDQQAGQHYHAHADYHTGRSGTDGYDGRAPGFYKDPLANRFATLLIYLNDGFAGGETQFPLARCGGGTTEAEEQASAGGAGRLQGTTCARKAAHRSLTAHRSVIMIRTD
eukprot:COSAG01_NODE_645_length_14553_cov_32.925227_6_plen_139_part_00